MKVDQYEIIEKIAETKSSLIFRGIKKGKKNTVVIKTLKEKHPSPSERARFKQEYETIKSFELEGVINAYEIIHSDDGFSLILEDFESISLKDFLKSQRTETELFLEFAIKLANTLAWLHRKSIIHRDIKPHNILINPKTKEVKITDFGISAIITGIDNEVYNPEYITGTLPYISPEQTGRMNLNLDYRTDIYSLGITFFEMVTGIIPFMSNDPLEIIHCHIAREAPAPDLFNPELPTVISDIIKKMMAKSPEDRYQNAFGLVADLEECQRQFIKQGYVNNFTLAEKDIANKFIIPQKLYGREKEVKALLDSFDKARKGNLEVMLVTGVSGIGKSAVIMEIHKAIVASRGYFIAGKYEQYRTDTPYSAIIQAFTGIIKQILTENEDNLKNWKQLILEVLGVNIGIISEIIPEIELITGPQPNPADCSIEDAQQRFIITFELFVSIFAKKTHPVTLFLDDIQWIDLPSLTLLKNIMQNTDINFLQIIISYRDNEVTETHPFTETINEVKKNGYRTSSIHLEALKVEDISNLTCNFLKCSPGKTQKLSSIIFEKTAGNPFFINQFLKVLYDEKKLMLDPIKGWEWDDAEILKMKVTDNVIELMADKLVQLPESVCETLKIGSCIGNRFDLETIAFTLNKTMAETLIELNVAIDEGYLKIQDDMFFYNHDRIQEAAYSLIPEEDRVNFHYKIGKRILKNISGDKDLENKLFYITNQLNFAVDLITDTTEIAELSILNYQTGMKAKSSTAYIPALYYFEKAAALAGDKCWDFKYDFALSLYGEIAETACITSEYDKMERYADIGIQNAKTILDQVKFYEIRINAHFARQNYAEAIQKARGILLMLGCKLPAKTNKLHIIIEFIKVKLRLFGKSSEKIFNLPKAQNPTDLAIARILYFVGISATFSDINLYALIILKRISHYLTKGKNIYGGMIFVSYGGFLMSVFKDTKNGIKFGDLAIRMADEPGAEMIKARTHTNYCTFIRHWKESLHECLKGAEQSYGFAKDAGDMLYTGIALSNTNLVGFFVNENWTEYHKEISYKQKLNIKCKQEALVQLNAMGLQFIENMTEKCNNPCCLQGRHFDEAKIIHLWSKNKNDFGFAYYYILKIIAEYMFGNYKQANQYVEEVQKYLKMVKSQIIYIAFTILAPLVRVADYPDSSKTKRKEMVRLAMPHLKRMEKWAKTEPALFTPYVNIIQAEIAAASGKSNKAEKLFEIAAESIIKYKSPIFLGLVYERAGIYYEHKKNMVVAGAYIMESYNVFSKAEMLAKKKHLEKNRANLLTNEIFNTSGATSGHETHSNLNLSTIIKSAQAFSGEMVFDRLLQTIMKISIESAGARKGFLILCNQEGAYFIEAEGSVEKSDVDIMKSIPLDTADNLSTSVVNYVARTQKTVVLHNACEEGDFRTGPYIRKNNIRSILAAPVKNQGKMLGVIYLENNFTQNAFQHKQLEILETLSTQAAISLENSRLFESVKATENEVRILNQELEQRVEKRTAALKEAYEQIKVMANTDPLTGLSNRRDVLEKIEYEITKTKRSKTAFSLIICDIDNFKSFNDKYGHDCGDYVLVSLAELITNNSREQDTIARWGGEEFLFLLPETDSKGALIIAEKIRKKINRSGFSFNSLNLNISMTFGISTATDISKDINYFFKKADEALYEGKQKGKNCVVVSNHPTQ